MALHGSPVECPFGSHCLDWARRYIHDCLCSPRDIFSFVLGMLSVLSWGVAELPQIVTHFKAKSTEGISIAFLMTWLIGDIFNLVGCYLEPATLPTQFYMALLYTITTLILVGQVVYYEYLCKRWLPSKEETLEETFIAQKHEEVVAKPVWVPERPEEGTPVSSQPISGVGVPTPRHRVQATEWYYTSARSLASSHTPTTGSILSASRVPRSVGMFASLSPQTGPLDEPGSAPVANSNSALLQTAASSLLCLGGLSLRFGSSFSGMAPSQGVESAVGLKFLAFGARKLFKEIHPSNRSGSVVKFHGNSEIAAIGEFFGWLMAATYMGGRIPQIWLNMRRGTVEGLSPLMFLFAFIGNLTYVGSILVRSLEWSRIKLNLAWLVDAIACILLDLFILCQFYYYSRKARACCDYQILK